MICIELSYNLCTLFSPRYIGPLRDEAASWAEKLKEVAEVLELWLEVQDLWQYLEAVFSNQVAAKVGAGNFILNVGCSTKNQFSMGVISIG